MYVLYGSGGQELWSGSDLASALRFFNEWPHAEYVAEVILTRNIVALKEGVVRAAVERQEKTEMERRGAVAGGLQDPPF